MLFTSGSFVILVIVTMVLFYLPILRRMQTFVLIAASIVFYSMQKGQAHFLLLLLFSIGFNALTSQAIYFRRNLRAARVFAVVGVVVNLSLLGFFKYAGLLGSLLPNAITMAGGPAHFLVAGIALPVGISFFTFEGISLVVDTFRARDAESFFGTDLGRHRGLHLASTTLFISFFPHLVAGPILKAHDFYPQIVPKKFREIHWDFCFRKLVVGYFLKMVIADGLKEYTLWMVFPYFQNTPRDELLAMVFSYSMQIFADFAGYSLIAIGVAGLFGYRLPENFEFPYISQSFSEFWRRWHISLSSWLREYLYFPLGGNRRGVVRTYFNLFVVMFLGGLWHGAAWSFAAWGSVHGVALAIERFFDTRRRKSLHGKAPPRAGPMLKGAKMLLVFSVVTAAWLLFKFPHFGYAVQYVRAIGRNPWNSGFSPRVFTMLLLSTPVVLYHGIYLIRAVPDGRDAAPDFPDAPASRWAVWSHQLLGAPRVLWGHVTGWPGAGWMRPAAYGVMLFLILVNSSNSGDFIYFQF